MRVDSLEKLKQIAVNMFLLISKSLVIITILLAFLVVFKQQLLISTLVLLEQLHPVSRGLDQIQNRAVFDAVEHGVLVEHVCLL